MFGWKRIGYIEGLIQYSEQTTFVERAVLYEREPFLWFKTRRAKIIGDNKIIAAKNVLSPHYRDYKLKLDDWLLGGSLDDIQKEEPKGEVIRLVFSKDK